MIIDVRNNNHSYFLGFAMMDGHFSEKSRNRGSLSIELSSKDSELLHDFSRLFNINCFISNRLRDTNYKLEIDTTTLKIYKLAFREELKEIGFSTNGKNFFIPDGILMRDFWRGVIDADGSLGFMKSGRPFVSLVAVEENTKVEYFKLIKHLTNKDKDINRNKRDNVYNIMLCDEDAQAMVNYLYYDNCLSINRKSSKANEIMLWERKTNKRKHSVKKWDKEQDEFISNNSIEDSIIKLNRTEKSIKTRLWRLNKKGSDN